MLSNTNKRNTTKKMITTKGAVGTKNLMEEVKVNISNTGRKTKHNTTKRKLNNLIKKGSQGNNTHLNKLNRRLTKTKEKIKEALEVASLLDKAEEAVPISPNLRILVKRKLLIIYLLLLNQCECTEGRFLYYFLLPV